LLFDGEEDVMQSIEDPSDSNYGARVLAAFRKRGLSTTEWAKGTVDAMEKASRLEFLALFKKHDTYHSHALIELIRAGTPEALVDRLVREKQARDQLAALIPIMFMGTIS
jgi:hypothetical protein